MQLIRSTVRSMAFRNGIATALRRTRSQRRQQRVSSSSSSSSGTQQDEAVKAFLAEIDKDPQLFGKVWHLASPQARHEMTKPLMANLSTAVGRREFHKADKNDDGVLDVVEFEHWLTRTLKRTAAAKASAAAASSTLADHATTTTTSSTKVSNDQLRKLAIVSAIPFVGFGFLDNAIMICSGSQIDAAFSSFGLSALAAAALGNLISDVAGIQAGGMIEAAAAKLGLPDPKLNLAQLKAPIVKRVQMAASAVGITVGCLLGMLPLLFMHTDEDRDLQRIFDSIDTNGNGKIDYPELVLALQEIGWAVTDTNAAMLRAKFHRVASSSQDDENEAHGSSNEDGDGKDLVVDFAQFQKFVLDF